MRIAFLHTADVHVQTFDRIFSDIRPDAQLIHQVEPDLLDRARNEGIDVVRDKVLQCLTDLCRADAVLCTCSTLGPLVDEAAETKPGVVRIDRPLMEQACAAGAKTLVALGLESTREATLGLLQDCASQANREITPTVVVCSEAWAHFEAGDQEAYAVAIARAVKERLCAQPDIESVILAQASMRVAEPKLEQISIPVYSSPTLAAQRCVEVALHALPDSRHNSR
jgi:hypothetical protein